MAEKEEIEKFPDFDRKKFMLILNNNESMISEIIDLFIDEFPRLHAELSNAIEKNNVEKISFFAHSIKGMCAGIYAEKMKFIAAMIGKPEDIDITPAYYSQLLNDLSAAFEAFKQASK